MRLPALQRHEPRWYELDRYFGRDEPRWYDVNRYVNRRQPHWYEVNQYFAARDSHRHASDDCSLTDIAKGALAGSIGGLVATWVMGQSQAAIGKATKMVTSDEDQWSSQQQRRQAEESSQSQEQQQHSATVQVATAASRRVTGERIPQQQKPAAGQVVHYGYGTLMGALYGALAEAFPIVGSGAGLGWGFLLWLLGDEVAVPLLVTKESPTKTPASKHVEALAAHGVYGLATDGIRRLVRGML